MPHVLVKMYSGRTDEQKAKLAEEITKALINAIDASEKSISVAIQDVEKENWTETVYKPDILANPGLIYKKPGYNPLA